MATQAAAGYGSTIQRYNVDTWEDIGEVKDIQAAAMSRNAIDATHMQSEDGFKEFIGGLADAGEVTFDVQWDSRVTGNTNRHDLIRSDFENGTRIDYRTSFQSGSTITYHNAIVTGITINAPMDDVIMASITLKISGKPTFA